MPVSRIEKLTERTGIRTKSNSRMEGAIDKDQMLSEGRVEAEDGRLDFEESSDDTEVELLLPRKGVDERGLRCAGGVRYSAGGLVSYGAYKWGSAEVEPRRTTLRGA